MVLHFTSQEGKILYAERDRSDAGACVDGKLKKGLGLIDVFSISTGAMISSGLFILPALAFHTSGPALIIAYVLAGFLVVPAMLSKAELATAMPRAGGDYFYIERTFGPALGTLGGIAAWFSLSFKSAFALIGIGAYAALIPHVDVQLLRAIAVGCCLLFTVINLLGVKPAGRVQVFLVAGLLAILALYILRGLPAVQIERFSPFMPHGVSSLFATAGLVYVSYGGLTKVASVAEEVKNPGRNLPLGMILSLSAATVLYALAVMVTVGVLGELEKNHLTPISDAAGVFMGSVGAVVLAIAALLAFISTANAGLMAASRFPLAMSRDGLLPDLFQRVTKRFRTPHYSIMATAVFMIAVILFLELEMLVKVASLLKILLFASVNLSVIIMRESKILNYQPKFRTPLFPWMQIAGLVGAGFLVVEMGKLTLLTTALFFTVGLAWYWFYGRIKVRREFALIHVVERITAKELTSYTLETELKEILQERDEIIEDRFDRLIRDCPILDLDHPLSRDQCFQLVSNQLASEVNLEEVALFELFSQREKQSTTVIRPGLAIPHIVIPGEGKFEVLLVRSRAGIVFSEEHPPVHAVFVLAGSRDERPFHLRALMAIAQIAQEADFDPKWLAARSPDALRDVILLGKRRRG